MDLTSSDQFYGEKTKTFFFFSYFLFLVLTILISSSFLTLFLHFAVYFVFTQLMYSGGFELSIFSL